MCANVLRIERQLIAEGSAKLSSVPSGGAAVASSGGAAAGGAAAAEEEKAEEKKEEEKVCLALLVVLTANSDSLCRRNPTMTWASVSSTKHCIIGTPCITLPPCYSRIGYLRTVMLTTTVRAAACVRSRAGWRCVYVSDVVRCGTVALRLDQKAQVRREACNWDSATERNGRCSHSRGEAGRLSGQGVGSLTDRAAARRQGCQMDAVYRGLGAEERRGAW